MNFNVALRRENSLKPTKFPPENKTSAKFLETKLAKIFNNFMRKSVSISVLVFVLVSVFESLTQWAPEKTTKSEKTPINTMEMTIKEKHQDTNENWSK